jgi:hypothetical protein
MRRNLILLLIALIVIITVTVYLTNYYQGGSVCGNGVCEIKEDCKNCPQDCVCKANEYCTETGICKPVSICGDSICSPQENSTQVCCEDCGCPFNEICNKYTHRCQLKSTISSKTVEEIINNYLTENNITGKIISIQDTYYENQAVKQISVDCREKDVVFPCRILFYVNDTGNIVEVIRTT